MKKEYCLIYIGYLTAYHYNDPVILCVGDEKFKVKYYLKDVRKLEKSQYEIREVVLDWESAYSLYDEYILEEFDESYPLLTVRDINALMGEINSCLSMFEDTYDNLKAYIEFASQIKKFVPDINQLVLAANVIDKHLSKVKNIKRISRKVMELSPVLSANIIEYLDHMGYIQEDKELTQLFYRRMLENE